MSKDLWLTRSPDLIPPDLFLWGLLNPKVYTNTPRTIGNLKYNIPRRWQPLLQVCHEFGASHPHANKKIFGTVCCMLTTYKRNHGWPGLTALGLWRDNISVITVNIKYNHWTKSFFRNRQSTDFRPSRNTSHETDQRLWNPYHMASVPWVQSTNTHSFEICLNIVTYSGFYSRWNFIALQNSIHYS
jgi:hypothetical protein